MKSCLFWLNVLADLIRFLVQSVCSKSSLAAENLFLRKQLAFYQERKVGPQRIDTRRRWAVLRYNWMARRAPACADFTNLRLKISKSGARWRRGRDSSPPYRC